VDSKSTTSTLSGHTWSTKDSNFAEDTSFIDTSNFIFTRPISERTRGRIIQEILRHHPSIYQNYTTGNPFPSLDNQVDTILPFPLDKPPLNNLPSHNLDPEPLQQTQKVNQKKKLKKLSDNQKSNNKPLNKTSTQKCPNQQTQPLQVYKQLPQLLPIQQEFSDTELLDLPQKTKETHSTMSLESHQQNHQISLQQHQQSNKSIDPNMLN